MIKAIIFDCFGVIVGRGFNYTFTVAGGDPKQDKQFLDDMLRSANLGLISEKDFNRSMAKQLGLSDSEWQAARKRAELADNDLLDYISELRRDYKTALLSNSNKGVLSQKVGEANLERCFDEVVCSAEVGLIKPNSDIYELTAKRLGVAARECVFIDDHESFVRAAEEVGMKGITYQDLDTLKADLNYIISH